MVGFGVADHHQVDLVQADGCLNLFQKFFCKGGLDRIDQCRFVLPPHHVGIVGCAIVGRKQLIKYLQIGVPHTDPGDIVGNLLVLLHNLYRLSFSILIPI